MRNPFKKNGAYDDQIMAALARMDDCEPDSAEYKALQKTVTLLTTLQANSQSRLNPDTVLVVAGNLLGVFMIIMHEYGHAITSKALSLVLRPRS